MAAAKNGNGRTILLELAEWRGSVTATLEGLVKQVTDMGTRIESAFKDHVEEDRSTFKDLGERMVVVEKITSSLTTKIAIYSSLVGAGVGGAATYFSKFLGL